MSSFEDRRIRRSKMILRNALINLLLEKELNEITISELTDYADVNRGTFYSHYQDIFHLFSEIEQEVLNVILKIIQPIFDDYSTWKHAVKDFLIYSQNNEQLISIILRVNGSSFNDKIISILHSSVESIDEITFSEEKREYYEYLYVYCITGIISIMQSWQKRGHIHTIEEMTELIELLILRTFPSLRKEEKKKESRSGLSHS